MMRSIMLWLPSMPAGVVRWLASCIKRFRRWRLPIIPPEEVEGGDRSKGIPSTISRWAMRFTRRSSRRLSLWKEIAEQRPDAAFSVKILAERERLAAEGNIVQPLKWHLNLPLCNRQILLHCGVVEENIQDCGICTFAHSDEYFSVRKLGIESGRESILASC